MVVISNYVIRENADGENFIALLLTGGVEMAKSKKTGKFYATTKNASVPCTFDEEVAKQMVGTKMPGVISKVPCEPFSYLSKSGEEVEIDFTYEYQPEAVTVAEEVIF
ncbi:MAG: hypothetical protein ACSHXL_03440 [Bacteroidota bacterium]